MTIKLYWADAHLVNFTARVLDIRAQEKSKFVLLDKTAFYPLGGGQPCDQGTLNGHPVESVSINEDGEIWHELANKIEMESNAAIVGEVSWNYRLEMMQQHTGQHILSQAFWQLFEAETRGFRINSQSSEIDLALDLSMDCVPAAITQAEHLANNIVFENRPIRSHQLSPVEAAKLPLRKESFMTDCVRVIEIADYDWSPCGGTHAKATGEVGLIAVSGWERAKKMIRLKFVCGSRALADYRIANAAAENIARKFSVGRDQSDEAVQRLLDEHKKLLTRNRALSEIAAKLEAAELLGEAQRRGDLKLIVRNFIDRSFDELKLLAHQLVKNEATITLLALSDGNNVRLAFARSPELTTNMQELMKTVCEMIGGKGGGTPDFAQGGGVSAEIENVLEKICANF